MKANKIYVGGSLTLSNGLRVDAAFPPRKGEKTSYFLMENGKVATVNGARIHGQGVPKFLEAQGFSLAPPEDPRALALAEHLDVKEGSDLFQRASVAHAEDVHARRSTQFMRLVPFAEDQPSRVVEVQPRSGFARTVFDLQAGLGLGGVSIDYVPQFGDTYHAKQGWLLELNDPESKYPRLTEYGGTMEQACYMLCAVGLAKLVGRQHLEDTISEEVDAPLPRGYLRLQLLDEGKPTPDELVVGVNAVDEAVVIFERAGKEVFRRSRLPGIKLGEVIGFILSVVVHVRERDADAAEAAAKPKKVRRTA